MPSWFDLMSLDATGPEDEAGIKSASALVGFSFRLMPLRELFAFEHWFIILDFLDDLDIIVMILIPLKNCVRWRDLVLNGFVFQVNSLIAEEVKAGVPSERIMLGGFSQVSLG